MTKKLELGPTTAEEDTALALADFYDEGYSGHIPTVAEEHLAFLPQVDKQNTTSQSSITLG
jgi:hypothetical protein